jgi:hypothetical protein
LWYCTGNSTIAVGRPSDAKEDQRYGYNLKKSPGMLVFYRSDPSFLGADTATIEMIFVSALSRTVTYSLAVK